MAPTSRRSAVMPALLGDLAPERHVLIAGPTASGKSALALALAEAGGGIIVNADAMQVYSCWRILTARPGPAEEARAPHRLYGHVPCDAPYSVARWLDEVAALLRQGTERLIVTGGTGLYFTALTEGLAPIPPVPAAIRAEAERRLAQGGTDRLTAEIDAQTLARIDAANPRRVQRAWEVLRATGRGLAAWQDETPAPLLRRGDLEALVVEVAPERLAARIDARFDAMLRAGALEEVRANLSPQATTRQAAQAIGARELAAHLRGEMDLDSAVAAAKAATRRYAKRQRSWFRNRMTTWRKIARPEP